MARDDLQKFANRNNRHTPFVADLPDTGGSTQRRGMVRRGNASMGGGFGSSVVRTQAKPYHPLFSSPDRLQLPVQLAQLNQYWRLYYNVDPIIGGVIDMHGDMPWSDAHLSMITAGDESKEILEAYEAMMTETELLSWLPRLTREYYIVGEVFPYLFWDEDEGLWHHITLHNPDYIEVVDSPLIDDDPILTLRPSQEMRRILQSSDPRYVRLRQKLPSDILQLLAGGKNLPLDNLHASHIARRAFPYDIRGTSIVGRMFRILMYEDAVFNGQIQQAQRHALPLRVFKIGDPTTGWMPGRETQEEFANLLAEVEVDPLAALIYHYGLTVEYHGMEGKQLKLTQEWDIIERAKLISLGVSKAFLHGEVTYASANAGLQVLMMRYRSFRNIIMNDWVYKKVFATMAELRGFYRTTKKTDDEYGVPDTRTPTMEKNTKLIHDKLMKIAEINDPNKKMFEMLKLQPEIDALNRDSKSLRVHIPMYKAAGDENSRVYKKKKLLYPTVEFEKRLDTRQDESILRFWLEMVDKGMVSPRTVVHGAGLDYKTEQATIASDANMIMRNALIMKQITEGGAGGGGGGGGGVGIVPPGMEGEEGGIGIGAPGEGSTPPGGAGGIGPGGASTRRKTMKKRSLKSLPPEVASEVDILNSLGDKEDPNFLVEG